MFENDAYRSALRKYRAAAGPMPTLAESARTFAWAWAQCALPCSHHAAIPLDRAADRLGAGATTDDLCARLVCTVCGRRRATLRMASWRDIATSHTPLPRDKIAIGFAGACGDVC
jgi:hypothetical protein